MFNGGNATLYVSDFEAAVRFYTESLGLKLRFRAENHWAEVVAGPGLVIGIHPVGPHTPQAGTAGAVQLGLNVDGPLEAVVATLKQRGVQFDNELIADEKSGMKFAYLRDCEGNALYLWEHSATPA